MSSSSMASPLQEAYLIKSPEEIFSSQHWVSIMTYLPTSSPAKKSPRIRPVPAVTRSIAILRLLARTKEPMNVKSIADELNLVPSTCLHILRALTSEKLLAFDPASKRYRLGVGMLALVRGFLESNPFARLVQPKLDELAQKWEVTAIGVEALDINQMVVTTLSHSKVPFRLHVDVGSRFPGLISATGRLVAAFGVYSKKEIKAQFSSLRWQQPLKFEEWWREVEIAREQGYSSDEGSYISGITLLAAPVLDAQQHITHSIVVAYIINQLSSDQIEQLIQELKAHAKYVSGQLFSLG